MASYVCHTCRAALRTSLQRNGAVRKSYHRPSFAPKPVLDLRHIRQNPGLYEQNCIDRNYPAQARNSWRILELHEKLISKQKEVLALRQRNNSLGKDIQQRANDDDPRKAATDLLEEARKLKEDINLFEAWEGEVKEEMESLALSLPNLSSQTTPVGEEPVLIEWILGDQAPLRDAKGWKGHVDIGKELNILDFEASATTSGWGWYFLKNEGALLEQAVIQFALNVALEKGWTIMTPPSLVYEHISSACGFMPRDQHGETQIYSVGSGDKQGDEAAEKAYKPNLVLTGTAEIPFAASQANKTLLAKNLPLKVAGPSRCYRAEAGARGVDTKGLYRVHEFTKVEMFAWTVPESSTSHGSSRFGDEEQPSQTDDVFDEMLDIQRTILTSLGLHAKVLEMPTADLGASAIRKVDIEAFFPSRLGINDGYGEVTSASMCTDYQSRRLNTRLKHDGGSGRAAYPHTLNGTAMAVPRVLACLLENGWDESTESVRIPECLGKWMPGGLTTIGPRAK